MDLLAFLLNHLVPSTYDTDAIPSLFLKREQSFNFFFFFVCLINICSLCIVKKQEVNSNGKYDPVIFLNNEQCESFDTS